MTDGTIAIHVLSDSLGETGDMVARAAMAQFEPGSFRIERLPKIITADGLREQVAAHCGKHCIFLYTFVDENLQVAMERLCEQGVNGVDLLGPSVRMLSRASGISPTGEVGAIHRTDREYFDRIDAMEFAVKHDDGRNPEGIMDADIVLIGVSRTSKTPLAMYLAFKGYRAANIPLAHGTEPPRQLFEVDPERVFGLVTRPDILLEVRTVRMRELGTWVPHYAEMEAIVTELEEARALMRRIGCLVVHTDDRAVEESAQEIIRHLSGGHGVQD